MAEKKAAEAEEKKVESDGEDSLDDLPQAELIAST